MIDKAFAFIGRTAWQNKIETIALVAFIWRVVDPKGSYSTLYDIANWLSSSIFDWGWMNNVVNFVLVDNFNEVLFGIFVRAILLAIGTGFVALFVLLKNSLRRKKQPEGAASQ